MHCPTLFLLSQFWCAYFLSFQTNWHICLWTSCLFTWWWIILDCGRWWWKFMPLYFHIWHSWFRDTNLSTVSFQSVRRIPTNTLVANERHLEDKSRMKIVLTRKRKRKIVWPYPPVFDKTISTVIDTHRWEDISAGWLWLFICKRTSCLGFWHFVTPTTPFYLRFSRHGFEPGSSNFLNLFDVGKISSSKTFGPSFKTESNSMYTLHMSQC